MHEHHPVNEGHFIRIWHENLAATRASERLPLSALTVDDHIHGGLRLMIGGRLVPSLGYFGPDDVCFNTWLEELWSASHAFESSANARYVFDEGEQGQPAFVFERIGDRAYFTIADAEFSGGKADPNWQRVEFSHEEFLAEHARFRDTFLAALRAEAPTTADSWIHQNDPKARGLAPPGQSQPTH
jgi:hypothetical protein